MPLWAFHRARLASGGCDEASLDRVEAEIERVCASPDVRDRKRTRLSVLVEPSGEIIVRAHRRLSSLDVPGGPLVAPVRVSGPPVLPPGAAKPADRGYWDAAQRQAKAQGAHIAVLVDGEGRVIDGGTSTVWISREGVLVTPPAPPAVAGVARAFVLDRAGQAGIEVRIAPLTWHEVASAEEVLLTNAFGGAVPVRGRGGALSSAIIALFAAAWSGDAASGTE